jgi:hypothetical protein
MRNVVGKPVTELGHSWPPRCRRPASKKARSRRPAGPRTRSRPFHADLPAEVGVRGSVARTLNKGDGTIDTRTFVQHDSAMQLHGARDAGNLEQLASQRGALPRIRGWLLVYIAALAVLLLHGAGLTIASIVIYAHPAAGLHSFVPLSSLLFYVITNVILILYTVVLFILISQRRRSAILNNIIFDILSITFLVAWHLIGEKSTVGTLVDSASIQHLEASMKPAAAAGDADAWGVSAGRDRSTRIDGVAGVPPR